LDLDVKQLRLLCVRVSRFVIATLDANDNLECVMDSDIALFVPIGKMNKGAVLRKLHFVVE
jgi:hypothetical protein